MLRMLLDVALPEAEHSITAGGHVGVLRNVKLHPFALALIWIREFIGVTVPVIAVELDHQTRPRQESIDTELITDQVLTLIGYVKAVEDRIGGALKMIWMQFELLDIHAAEHGGAFWVGITTRDRTIGDVVGLRAGWRQPKGLAAYLADMLCFVAALPHSCMGVATKEAFGCFKSSGWQIENLAAQLARNITPILSLRAFVGLPIAGQRAIGLIRAQAFRNRLAATLTGNRSDRVCVHSQIIALLRDTVKPMGIMRYA